MWQLWDDPDAIKLLTDIRYYQSHLEGHVIESLSATEESDMWQHLMLISDWESNISANTYEAVDSTCNDTFNNGSDMSYVINIRNPTGLVTSITSITSPVCSNRTSIFIGNKVAAFQLHENINIDINGVLNMLEETDRNAYKLDLSEIVTRHAILLHTKKNNPYYLDNGAEVVSATLHDVVDNELTIGNEISPQALVKLITAGKEQSYSTADWISPNILVDSANILMWYQPTMQRNLFLKSPLDSNQQRLWLSFPLPFLFSSEIHDNCKCSAWTVTNAPPLIQLCINCLLQYQQ